MLTGTPGHASSFEVSIVFSFNFEERRAPPVERVTNSYVHGLRIGSPMDFSKEKLAQSNILLPGANALLAIAPRMMAMILAEGLAQSGARWCGTLSR